MFYLTSIRISRGQFQRHLPLLSLHGFMLLPLGYQVISLRLMMPMPNSIDSALSSSFNTDYQGFKTDVYFRLDLIETTKQNLMVR
jgi:hypothetical protein